MFSGPFRRQLLKLMGGLIIGTIAVGSIPFVGKLFTGPVQAQQAQRPVANPQTLAATSVSDRELRETSVTLTLPLTEEAGPGPFTGQSLQERSVFLNVEGIKYNPSNSIPYEIYINLPKGVTSDPESPHYAGLLALYAYPSRGATFSLDINDAVRKLQQRNLITGDSVSVTFVPPSEEIAELQRTGRRIEPVCFRRVTITSGSVASL